MARLHRLTGEGYAGLRRTMLQTWLVLAVVLATVAVVALQISADELTLRSRLFVVVAVFVILTLVLVNGLRAGLKAWAGFELLVSDDFVERRLPGQPTVEVTRGQAHSIIETANRGLLVKGSSGQPTLFIPSGIEDYASVRELLSQWGTIELKQPRAPWIPVLLGGAATAVLLFAPYLSSNPVTVVSSAVLLAAFMTWTAYTLRTNPDVTPRLRRVWWFPLLPAGVAVARAISLFF